jgi:hypothetical protein
MILSEVEKRNAEAELVAQFAALPAEMQRRVLDVLTGMRMTLDAQEELAAAKRPA